MSLFLEMVRIFFPYPNKLFPSLLFIIIIIIINFLFVIIIIIIEQTAKETPTVVVATNDMSCDESCLQGRLIWEMMCRLNGEIMLAPIQRLG